MPKQSIKTWKITLGKGEKKLTIALAISITIPTKLATSITIFFKGNNQRSIALVYNFVFHSKTKHRDIQYYYICNEIAA